MHQASSRVLATIGVGAMTSVLSISGPTFQNYAARHGYDYVVGSGDSAGRPPAWGKVLLLRRLLAAYETVLWIDADAVVLDARFDIERDLASSDYQGLVAHRLGDEVLPNTGVWIVRGARGRALLDAIWNETKFIDHDWWENAALMHLMGFQIRPGKLTRATAWQSGTKWLDDHWNRHVALDGHGPARIVHYAGQSNEYRRRRMRLDLAANDPRRIAPLHMLRASWKLARSGATLHDGR